MNKKIDNSLVLRPLIIEIGKTENAEKYKDNIQLKEANHRNFPYPNMSNLSTEETKYYFKGLVICEKYFGWEYGSVPPTVKAFEAVLEPLNKIEDLKEIKELYDWAFKHKGSNPYTPTGFVRHGRTKSYLEFIEKENQKVLRYRTQATLQRIIHDKTKKQRLKQQKIHEKRNEGKEKKIKEDIKKFCLQNNEKKVYMVKHHQLSFPINMLPQEELDLFLKKVKFSSKEKEAFISKLPRRSNTRIELLKEAIKDL